MFRSNQLYSMKTSQPIMFVLFLRGHVILWKPNFVIKKSRSKIESYFCWSFLAPGETILLVRSRLPTPGCRLLVSWLSSKAGAEQTSPLCCLHPLPSLCPQHTQPTKRQRTQGTLKENILVAGQSTHQTIVENLTINTV